MAPCFLTDLPFVTAPALIPEHPAPAEPTGHGEPVWIDPYDAAHRRDWLKIALVLVLAAIAFFPALGNGFAWHDRQNVLLDETQSTFTGLIYHWRHPRTDEVYRPVAFTAYWTEFGLTGGVSPLP